VTVIIIVAFASIFGVLGYRYGRPFGLGRAGAAAGAIFGPVGLLGLWVVIANRRPSR
jgi:hypothetical protein